MVADGIPHEGCLCMPVTNCRVWKQDGRMILQDQRATCAGQCNRCTVGIICFYIKGQALPGFNAGIIKHFNYRWPIVACCNNDLHISFYAPYFNPVSPFLDQDGDIIFTL
jgi:hypothetical protein